MPKTAIFLFFHNGFELLDILATEDDFPKHGNNCTETNQSKLNSRQLKSPICFWLTDREMFSCISVCSQFWIFPFVFHLFFQLHMLCEIHYANQLAARTTLSYLFRFRFRLIFLQTKINHLKQTYISTIACSCSSLPAKLNFLARKRAV